MGLKNRDLIVARIQYLESIRSYLYSCATEATILVDSNMKKTFLSFRDKLNDVIDDLYLELT